MRSVPRRTVFATIVALLVLACVKGEDINGPSSNGGGGPTPSWAAISPRSAELRALGATVQLHVVDDGGAVTSVAGLTWRSLDAGIATVDGVGLVRAVAPGSTRIVAAAEGRTDTMTVAVRQAPAAIVVSPTSVTMQVGSSQSLSAGVNDSLGSPIAGEAITWTSSAPGIASVSSAGVVSAITAGTATITATADKASTSLTVTVTAAPPAPVASVAVTPAQAGLLQGQTLQLAATTRDAGGNILGGRAVTWTSDAPALVSVSSAGLVTALAAGKATITATSEGVSGTSSITVTLPAVASVAVTPAAPSLVVGATVQLSATTKDASGNTLTGRTVTWSSANTGIATVSATGLVTAKAAGTVVITATSEGKSGTATVTVTQVAVASVSVSPTSASLQQGQTQQLTATARDASGNVLTGRTFTWATSAGAVATVSGTGVVTAVAGGTATITVTSEGKSATATITVAATQTSGTYYVSVAGSDANPGTASAPFRTIQKAANVINPGETVVVMDGVWTDTDGNGTVVDINRGGTASAPVTFRAANKWGAKLDGQNGLAHQGFDLNNNVGYVRIEGFEIYGVANVGNPRGSASGVDLFDGGHDSWIVGNHIHDIGRLCTNSGNTNGQVAIFLEQPNVTIEENVIHDIGRFFPGENGCTYSGGFTGYMTLDHGIYVNGDAPSGSGALIRNNIFYNTRHGWGVQLYPGTLSNIRILNNTFAFSNPNKHYTGIVIDATINGGTIANNVFYNPEGGLSMEIGSNFSGSVTVANNLTMGSAITDYGSTPPGMSLSNNLVATDPLFASAAGFDFHLTAGSPAIDRGQTLTLVPLDIERRARPRGAGWDIGAYEY